MNIHPQLQVAFEPFYLKFLVMPIFKILTFKFLIFSQVYTYEPLLEKLEVQSYPKN